MGQPAAPLSAVQLNPQGPDACVRPDAMLSQRRYLRGQEDLGWSGAH
jgi:hypothetical protein